MRSGVTSSCPAPRPGNPRQKPQLESHEAAFSPTSCPLTLTATGQPAGGSLCAVPAGDLIAPSFQAAATFISLGLGWGPRLTRGSPWSHRKFQHPSMGGKEIGTSHINHGSAGTPGQLSLLLQLSPPQGRLPRMPQVGRSLLTAHLGLRSTVCGVSAGRCLCSVSGQDLGQLAQRVWHLMGAGRRQRTKNQAAQRALQPHS